MINPRKLLGIITGSRRRRFRRACLVHECHRWEMPVKQAYDEMRRSLRGTEEHRSARRRWEQAIQGRDLVGVHHFHASDGREFFVKGLLR